jgi:formimidoylglutamate deiminase
MNKQYYLQSALVSHGWAHGLVVTVSAQGLITDIAPTPAAAVAQAPAGVEIIGGMVVPGMSNAHSHAFQRAMAGSTEFRISSHDSFWTWRQAMYRLANRVEPDDLQVIATQLFVEMLKAGYTSVAEFHYLHRQRNGVRYAGKNELWEAVGRAADDAGIALSFLPTLYLTCDFGSRPLKREQARFAMDTTHFLRSVQERIGAERALQAGGSNAVGPEYGTTAAAFTRRTGAAFHSLRAVPYENLVETALALREIDASMPVHIHVAEQLREVQACRRETGHRPIELLLQSGLLTPHWCLVHATHATPEELQGIAAKGSTVCISVSTEANLGDGAFDTLRYLGAGGRLCIGSDSQATVSPAEELRWLEYQQRLRRKRRGVLADETEPHVGTRLWRDAALHGAAAIGQPAGSIAVGHRADWLVLDPRHPALAGAVPETALDHVVFAGAAAAIRHVMVAGRWVIRDGRHGAETALAERFADLMGGLA